jgi:adenosylhomocysteine nucleosidase
LGHVKDGSRARILVVTGLLAEAAIAKGPDCVVICGGGMSDRLESKIREALKDDIAGIVSFGIAGGLSPDVRAGTIILGNAIMAGPERFPADAVWLQRLSAELPQAVLAAILGVDRPAVDVAQKARLHAEYGAAAVDMESHVSARLAEAHGLPFVALRVVADPAHRSLPPVASVAMKSDGGLDIAAIVASLMRRPRQLSQLAATAIEAGRAFRVLRKSRQSLDGSFCFPAMSQRRA